MNKRIRHPQIHKGQRYETKNCGSIEIVSYVNSKEVHIKFLNTGTVKVAAAKEIRVGNIKDLMQPSALGIGFHGQGEYKGFEGRKPNIMYNRWFGMLARCYNPKRRDYPRYGGRGVTVCKQWHNMQTFASWFYENHRDNFELDKDILVQDSLVYSPGTCIMIPANLNKMLTFSNAARGDFPLGVSKREDCCKCYMSNVQYHLEDGYRWEFFSSVKEAHDWYVLHRKESIAIAAAYYLERGDIDEKTYTALLNYKIEEYF